MTLVGLGALAAPASAQDGLATSVAELEALAEKLASDEAEAREEAFYAYLDLEEEALPAIEQRIADLRRPALPSDPAYDSLNSFRHQTGSRRADDAVDILPGVLPVLEEDRSRVTVSMAERYLLARALEAMGSTEAGEALCRLISHDSHVWRWEARNFVRRLGPKAIPILIAARRHDDRGVRRLTRWGLRELGADEAGDAVQVEDIGVLADIVRAYGVVRDMDAMPVVVSFATHDRSRVRNAARWSIEQYGQNAIWQLRRAHRNLTGSRDASDWSWQQTMRALYAADDAERLAPVREELDAGMAALSAGDLDETRERFDTVLERAPDLPQRAQMAPGYAALAERHLEADELVEAERLYRRALRLAPADPAASSWRAQLTFIDGERNLQDGIADLQSYEATLVLMPGHEGASTAIETLTGDEELAAAENRRWAAALAAFLVFLAGGLYLVFFRRREEPVVDEDELVFDDYAIGGDDFSDTVPGTIPSV